MSEDLIPPREHDALASGELDIRELGRTVAELQDADLARKRVAERAFERFELAREGSAPSHPRVRRSTSGGVVRDLLRSRRASLLLIAAVLAMVLGGFLFFRQSSAPAAFLEGEDGHAARRVGVGDAIRAEQNRASVSFSDGTTLVLTAHSRGRLIALDRAGGEVAVEDGRASVSVPPHQGRSWIVDAGPYRVIVVGTRFDVAWDEGLQRFDIVMFEGRVEVRGPKGTSVFVSAGEHLSLEPSTVARGTEPAGEGRLAAAQPAKNDDARAPIGARGGNAESQAAANAESGKADPANADAAKADAAKADAAKVEPSAATAKQSDAAPAKPVQKGWRALARESKFEEAVKAADALGFESVCGSASAADLLMLGDAARLAGRSDRARTAYAAVRENHAGSSESARAAFALGVMAFPSSSALPLLEEYLGQSPNGPLAPEALGRIVEIRHRAGNTAEARAAAKRYLASYPNGAHAKLSRSIVEAP